MPINYSEFREVVERAMERGLIAHPKRKKRVELKEQTHTRTGRKRGKRSNPARDEHQAIKIACPACGARKGQGCKLTIGFGEADVPVHASRIFAAIGV